MNKSKADSRSAASSALAWHLSDAAAIARTNPYTFYKPSMQALARLRPGHRVKLIFELNHPTRGLPSAERMWVLIQRVEGDRYLGRLDNDPVFIPALKAGTEIEFANHHVINVEFSDPVPDPTLPYQARCLVTTPVLTGKVRVGCLARHAPITPDDSGWRIWAGNESDTDMENEDNYAFVSLGAVLSKDDSFVSLLATPAPCLFARKEDCGSFERIDVTDARETATLARNPFRIPPRAHRH